MRTNTKLIACVLAGGLSSRMGLNKSRLKLGRRTLLGHVRAAAEEAGLKVRVLRNDVVRRCGPLGGIYTALETWPAEAVLFLACDMPFVSGGMLKKLMALFEKTGRPVFVELDRRKGFPCIVSKDCLDVVAAQISKRELSMQRLAAALGAGTLRVTRRDARQLQNINTQDDLLRAKAAKAACELLHNG